VPVLVCYGGLNSLVHYKCEWNSQPLEAQIYVIMLEMKKKYDIVCVQEAFITCDVKELWEKEWGGDMFFSTGTRQSLGQIIFVRKHALKNVECVYESKRIVTISFDTDKGKMFVVNA
jgi:hypothetical protein